MDPMTILIAAGLGTQLLSSMGVGQTAPTYEQINPETAAYYKRLQDLATEAQNMQDQYAAQSSGAIRNAQGASGDMARTEQQIEGLRAPDPNEWFETFLQQVPEYQAIAKGAAESFTEQQGRNLQEQARQLQASAVEQAASQFGGQAFSGAAKAAVGAAAAQPIADAQVNLGGLQSQMAGNNFNQLAGAGQGLAYQSQQDQFTNVLQQLSQVLGSQQSRGNLQLGAASGYGNLGSQYASLLSGLRGAQADVAQPVYQATPGQDPLAGIAQLLIGGAGLAQNIQANKVVDTPAVQETTPQYTQPNYSQQYFNYHTTK